MFVLQMLFLYIIYIYNIHIYKQWMKEWEYATALMWWIKLL